MFVVRKHFRLTVVPVQSGCICADPQIPGPVFIQGADDIVVIAGGVIPKQDYEYLYNAGVKCIFGPGTPIPLCARDVLDAVNEAQA